MTNDVLNHHWVRSWGEAIIGLQLSRSRPSQKTATRFVEQKTATLVRAYLGHARLDPAEHCADLNALDALDAPRWVSSTLFQPGLPLVEMPHAGIRVRRTWDAPLRATNPLDPAARERLEQLDAATNPRALRRTIPDGLHALLYPRPHVVTPAGMPPDDSAPAQVAR